MISYVMFMVSYEKRALSNDKEELSHDIGVFHMFKNQLIF